MSAITATLTAISNDAALAVASFGTGPQVQPDSNGWASLLVAQPSLSAAAGACTIGAKSPPGVPAAEVWQEPSGRPSAFTLDYLFWYLGGTALSWTARSSENATAGVSYSAATHGPMTTGQAYRLRVEFPASLEAVIRERFEVRFRTAFNASDGN